MRSKLAEANAKAPAKSVNTPISTPWQPHDPVPTYYQPHPPHPPQPSQLISPPQPTPNHPRARALWAYNEDGREPGDLIMSVGDVIDIVEETNADWWTGRNRGKQGIFPSNYVQKLSPEPSPQPYQEKLYSAPGYNDPPPQQLDPVNNPAAVNSVGLQQDEGQDKKKKKFGKFGNTVAHSAAGGLGFGAGAAVGSGIINALF